MGHARVDGAALRCVDAGGTAGGSGLAGTALFGVGLRPLFAFVCAGRVGWGVGRGLLLCHFEDLFVCGGLSRAGLACLQNHKLGMRD